MHENEHADDPATVAEAAEFFGVDVRTIHRRIRKGKLPATKLPGRTGDWLIPRDALVKETDDVLEEVAS